ncbi:MAG: isoprenylcysteine carboxylmethyltransferase family protein [Chloroflexota bacterium]
MSTWLVAVVWVVWFLVVSGTGYARSRSSDRVDRQATTASVRADVIMLLALAGGVAAAVMLPAAALPWDRWVTDVAGMLLVAAGLAVRQWAAVTLGDFFTRSVAIRDRQRVVTAGPYRYVRHPAYAGMLLSVVGLALTLGSWLSILIIVVGCLLANVSRIRAEESVLTASLGDEYQAYAHTRKRLIPGVW